MNYYEQAVQVIEEQQSKVKERSAPWMVGEQLKDICRREPQSAELICQDLQNEAMSIVEAEKKIKAFSDKNVGKEKCFCVTPVEAENILREFYGLSEQSPSPSGAAPFTQGGQSTEPINILDFLS